MNTQHPNPDHNIWNNNGTYWCHYTVHGPNNTAQRVRVSLETKDREEARKRRDDLLKNTTNLSTKVPWPTIRRGQAMPDSFNSAPYVSRTGLPTLVPISGC